MRILWLNWRDIKHPDAGGAEILTHEVMRRLVKKGYDVTLFSAKVANCSKNETIDGIKIIRDGGKYSVYTKAKKYYNKYKDMYDFVIDESNTKPFLTPKFVKEKPILALYHQLSREGWFYEIPFPLNYLGHYYLEWKWLSYYKDVPTVTVSSSTKEDLQKFGIKRIFIVPEGISVTPLSKVAQKESIATVIFIGRLKKHKLPHHAIEAFSMIKRELPETRMWVIGRGPMLNELKGRHIKDVTFYGYVNNELKYDLLSRAHLILVPAVREGWGLVVTESNAMGTPAIAYNIPGLKDSVKDGETGMLVKKNTPYFLASSAITLLNNRDLLDKLSNNALAFSRQFNWDNTANEFEKIINEIYSQHSIN